MDDTDRVVKLIDSAKNSKIEILAPDVNTSFEEFRAINNQCIAYGMAGGIWIVTKKNNKWALQARSVFPKSGKISYLAGQNLSKK